MHVFACVCMYACTVCTHGCVFWYVYVLFLLFLMCGVCVYNECLYMCGVCVFIYVSICIYVPVCVVYVCVSMYYVCVYV